MTVHALSTPQPVWEAYGGIMTTVAGVRRNGKPRAVLMAQVLVCFSEADAKAVAKAYPSLKFKKRMRAVPLAGTGEP